VATAGKRPQAERWSNLRRVPPILGISRTDIHEARIIRGAEVADPGAGETRRSTGLVGKPPVHAATPFRFAA